jgi:hypothetical protein
VPSESFANLHLWERHEQRVLAILRDALILLRDRRPADCGEPELNRQLFLCLLEVNSMNLQSGSDDYFDYPPIYEGRNPPTPGTEDSACEKKIPDLKWGYLDHESRDGAASARYFIVECKRLGIPTAAGWAFNARYVSDGISRFVHPDWRYGMDVPSGAMVGYVESDAPTSIVAEVNAEASGLGLPPLLDHGLATAPLHEFHHTVERPFEISPFRLAHLWIEAPPPTP